MRQLALIVAVLLVGCATTAPGIGEQVVRTLANPVEDLARYGWSWGTFGAVELTLPAPTPAPPPDDPAKETDPGSR